MFHKEYMWLNSDKDSSQKDVTAWFLFQLNHGNRPEVKSNYKIQDLDLEILIFINLRQKNKKDQE